MAAESARAQSASAAQAAPAVITADYSVLTARSSALAPADKARAQQLFATSFSLWQSGDFGAAEIGFKNGLEIDPANASANFYYGDCLARRKDKADAREYLARAVAFGGMSAEGLKAQAEIQVLAAAPTNVADMTADELSAAYVGQWQGVLVGGGFGSDTNPITFVITSVSGDELQISGDGPAGLHGFSVGHIKGGHIMIVAPHHAFLAPQVLDGHLISPGHMEGFITKWGPRGGKWIADKQ